MSFFQHAAAFLDRLNVQRFVLGMGLSGHMFLVRVDHCQMSTACSGWLRRWIRFGGRITAWPCTYGQKTDMPFVHLEEEADNILR